MIVNYKSLFGFDRAVVDGFMKAEEFRITTVTFVMSKFLSLSLLQSGISRVYRRASYKTEISDNLPHTCTKLYSEKLTV